MIAVSAWERFRGGTRATFVCGSRALRMFQTYRDAVGGSIRTLSVSPAELPGAIDRIQAESKDLRRMLRTTQGALATHEAARLTVDAPIVNGVRLIVRVLDGWDAAGLKAIAVAATAADWVAVALFSTAPPVVAVVARARDVRLDAQSILKNLMSEYGGRGGGKPDLAQGGGLDGDVKRIVESARAAIEGAVSM